MQPYTALLPDTPPRLTDGSVSDGWRLRKLEIKNCLSSYIRQRFNAFRATGTLTPYRADLLNKARHELTTAGYLEGAQYAVKIKAIATRLLEVLPQQQPLLSTWLTRLTIILNWSNKFKA